MPYHQRIDRGFFRFVNNDHCSSIVRAGLRLPDFVAHELDTSPWPRPSGTCPRPSTPGTSSSGTPPAITGAARGRAARRRPFRSPPRTGPTRSRFDLDGPFEDRLGHWLTLVQQGQVIEAYRVFLGFFQERERRRDLLAQLAFAGLIDVQDRMLNNCPYTTGHKSYRARATIELGQAIGWEDAHDVIYAGVLDMAVGPRWHSNYEMACQVELGLLADDDTGTSRRSSGARRSSARSGSSPTASPSPRRKRRS